MRFCLSIAGVFSLCAFFVSVCNFMHVCWDCGMFLIELLSACYFLSLLACLAMRLILDINLPFSQESVNTVCVNMH